MNRALSWQQFELISGEWRICLACNRWGGGRAAMHCFRVISRLGDGLIWYALMLGIALFGGQQGYKAALHMACVGMFAAILYRVLKRWTRRPRPFRSHAQIVAHIAPLDEFSFPSGHTLHAVCFTLVASAWYPQLFPMLLPFTLLIAASRVVLGLHYPSDVIVAMLIGFALAETSCLFIL
ncbi:MAG: phosphatase PAP2 family protein [Dokdonella sp.]